MNRIPFRLLVLPLLLLLSGCKAGDIGSSSSSAQVDNSEDNHQISGVTQCTTVFEFDAESGNCRFEESCEGIQVSSGDFEVEDASSCNAASKPSEESGGAALSNPGVGQGLDGGTL